MNEEQSSRPWHSLEIEEIYQALDTSIAGLSDAEAEKRLKENGSNELIVKKGRTVFQMLWEQFKDPMILILIAASILSFILDQLLEGIVILIIITLNAIISIIQEKKAESSLEALKNMTTTYAIALRQGEESHVKARDLVVGDIIMLEDGMKVPADVRLIDSSSLKIQESSLTGESVAAEKDANDKLSITTLLGDRTNMAYSSTFVTYGRGFGVVVETAMKTEVGKIAGLMDKQEDLDTPIKRKLASVGKILTCFGIIICIIIFIIGCIYKQPLVPLIMTAISLAISVIPEGLPATATIVLALGVQRMAKKGAIIRKLPAVETLGSATIICTDKTGTLTINQMTVTHMAANGDLVDAKYREVKEATEWSKLYSEIIFAGALCNNSEFDPDNKGKILGDPTEGALIMLARDFGYDHDELENQFPRLFEQPFDSIRKRMTTVHQIDNNYIAYTKGGIDEVLKECNRIITTEGIREITEKDIESIRKISDDLAQNALRVLSFAKKELVSIPNDEDDVESNLIFIGLVGMIDPPREEVKLSIKSCHKAGIRTAMITGDHQITAIAIAKELGIFHDGDTVCNGYELEEMSDEELQIIAATTTVYARVSPEHKLRIVNALKSNGEVVAMTGDGVNDAPALKASDIGIAMGISGTDVAKEASDMILTDDDFTNIVDAVEGGRRVYKNIQKVIQFLLAGNISEILTILIAVIFNLPAPLLAAHILWVNLATDTLPALALGVDPAEKNIMKQKPIKSNSLFEKDLIFRVILQGIFISIAVFIAFIIGYKDDLASGQGMAFCTIAFSQLFYSFSQRSNSETMFSKEFFKNKYLIMATLLSTFFMVALLFIPSIRAAFELSSINGNEWLIILGLSIIPTILVEILKLFKRIKKRSK